MIAADYPFLDILWTMFIFFAWVIWFWLLITVFGDVFRRRDLSGWGKVGWTVLVICLPYFGVFIYLIARGGKMHEHAVQAAQAQDTAFRQYVQQAAGTSGGGSVADELARLADIKAKGVISDAEFEQLKAKALASA